MHLPDLAASTVCYTPTWSVTHRIASPRGDVSRFTDACPVCNTSSNWCHIPRHSHVVLYRYTVESGARCVLLYLARLRPSWMTTPEKFFLCCMTARLHAKMLTGEKNFQQGWSSGMLSSGFEDGGRTRGLTQRIHSSLLRYTK
eukprot:COSAG01_NODE_36698_length_513_cov_5.589372_1_plen_143_part_00